MTCADDQSECKYSYLLDDEEQRHDTQGLGEPSARRQSLRPGIGRSGTILPPLRTSSTPGRPPREGRPERPIHGPRRHLARRLYVELERRRSRRGDHGSRARPQPPLLTPQDLHEKEAHLEGRSVVVHGLRAHVFPDTISRFCCFKRTGSPRRIEQSLVFVSLDNRQDAILSWCT